MARTAQAVDQEPIARLAEKVKALIEMLDQTRAKLAETTDDNARLAGEIEAMRNVEVELQAQLSSTQNEGAELKTLLAEREEIQARVSEILDQLDAISL